MNISPASCTKHPKSIADARNNFIIHKIRLKHIFGNYFKHSSGYTNNSYRKYLTHLEYL